MERRRVSTLAGGGLGLVLIAAVGTAAVVWAGADWGQEFKLVPDDAAPWDQIGLAVATDGQVALVGSPQDDDLGLESGSVYLYDVATGKALGKLTAADGTFRDFFGRSVAVEGPYAVVGAPGDHVAAYNSGSAYVFDATTWQQLRKLSASDGAQEDAFGRSVALSGGLAVIGAPGDDDVAPDSGAAYVFDLATGQELRKLTATGGAADDEFGRSVALSGTYALVGSYLHDAMGQDSGAVYVFDVTTGQQIHKLMGDGGSSDDWFGYAVALDGHMALIGAPHDWPGGIPWAGSAYVFDVQSGQQVWKLTPDDASQNDAFGFSLGLDGHLGAIGMTNWDAACGDEGAVYVFDLTVGEQLDRLTADDGMPGDWLGGAVDINNGFVVAGARGVADGGDGAGAAYVFYGKLCGADVHVDGLVDVMDLLALLGAWGPCEPAGVCPADLNGDGVVDVLDLLELLAAWGPCP